MPLICPSCGNELPNDARFCPKDGTTLAAVTTPARRANAEDPAADPLIGRVIDGRYRVRARLGAGGVGAVYEGEHVEIKKPVAIKVLHGIFASTEEFRVRFEREARAASRLDHPGCVSVIDFGRVARVEPMEGAVGLLGIPYLVMEFVRGKPLGDEPLRDAAEAVQIVLGILAALKHAHGLGIIHRDVKPANVMVLRDESGLRTKLLDFGLAKDLGGEGSPGHEPLTQAGTVFGTPSYLSPEQAAGGQADARSDLYSTGVVLFELACRRRPFIQDDPLDVVRDHMNTPPPPPRSLQPAISSELERVMLRALAKDPAARYQSAEELAAALAATPEGQKHATARALSTGRVSPQVPARPSLPVNLRRWLVAGAGVVLALLVTVIVWPRHKEAAPPPPAPVVTVAPVAPGALSHLQLAVDYQRKLWCSDAVEELERAMRADPNVRRDPEATRVAIACLTPKTREKAIRFLVERLGAEAKKPLEEAAAHDENQEVRRGAERALARLAGSE